MICTYIYWTSLTAGTWGGGRHRRGYLFVPSRQRQIHHHHPVLPQPRVPKGSAGPVRGIGYPPVPDMIGVPRVKSIFVPAVCMVFCAMSKTAVWLRRAFRKIILRHVLDIYRSWFSGPTTISYNSSRIFVWSTTADRGAPFCLCFLRTLCAGRYTRPRLSGV